jgi:cytochrome c-type biogenesis protein CcmH
MASPSLHLEPTHTDSAALMAVTKNIICRCGCNLSVYDCMNTMTCEVSTAMKKVAQAQLAMGKTPAQALDFFAQQYGTQVLAAPPKSGFNLAAWILPFAFLGAGIVVVFFALRRWRPDAATVKDAATGEDTPAPAPEVDQKYLSAIEEELKRET